MSICRASGRRLAGLWLGISSDYHLIHEGTSCLIDVDILLGGCLKPTGKSVLPHILIHLLGLRYDALLFLVALENG